MQLNPLRELLDRELTTRRRVPDPQALVAGGRQQPARVGRPSRTPDVGERGRPGCLAAGGEVDEPESSGLGPGQGVPVRRREREAVGGAFDGWGVLAEGQQTRDAAEMPLHQVLSRRIEGLVVRGPVDARRPHPTGHCEAMQQCARGGVPDDHAVVARGGRQEVPVVRVAAAFGQVGAAQVRATSAQRLGVQPEDAVLAGDGDRRPVGADVEAAQIPCGEVQVVGRGEQPAGVHVIGAHRLLPLRRDVEAAALRAERDGGVVRNGQIEDRPRWAGQVPDGGRAEPRPVPGVGVVVLHHGGESSAVVAEVQGVLHAAFGGHPAQLARREGPLGKVVELDGLLVDARLSLRDPLVDRHRELATVGREADDAGGSCLGELERLQRRAVEQVDSGLGRIRCETDRQQRPVRARRHGHRLPVEIAGALQGSGPASTARPGCPGPAWCHRR